MSTRIARPSHRIVMFAVAAVVILSAFAAPRPAMADQPQMHPTLAALHEGENHLMKVSRDKGGHRAKALENARAAIHQVELGIEYDRRH